MKQLKVPLYIIAFQTKHEFINANSLMLELTRPTSCCLFFVLKMKIHTIRSYVSFLKVLQNNRFRYTHNIEYSLLWKLTCVVGCTYSSAPVLCSKSCCRATESTYSVKHCRTRIIGTCWQREQRNVLISVHSWLLWVGLQSIVWIKKLLEILED